MIFYILKTILISIIIIVSFHYFYNYIINTFTIKKNKNILNDTIYNYNEIIKTLNSNSENILNKQNNTTENNTTENNTTENNTTENTEENNMKKELKDYYNNIKDKIV